MVLVASLVMCTTSALGVSSQGVIRVFCFGDVIEQYGGFNSYVVIQIDPAIETTLVPTRPGYLGGTEKAQRNLRIYMPRNYERLVRDYDLIMTSDADRTVFRNEWIEWMTRAIVDGGLGLEWLGSIGRSATQEHLDWSWTSLGGILPATTSTEYYKYGAFKIRIRDKEEELMKALPWETSPALANLDMQIPKEGSSIWAVTDHPLRWPLITYWEIDRGKVLCFASKFPNGVMPWARDWPLFPQAMIYLVYRTSDRDLPEDYLLFQRIMSSFSEYQGSNSVIVSIFSFVEEFGGNVDQLLRMFDDLTEMKSTADRAYLGEEYEECLHLMDQVRTEQNHIMEEALRAKDMALVWVYTIEWLAFTATFLVSGIVIWNLMVKRKYYREVGSSSLTL